jgi:hypothetical protein
MNSRRFAHGEHFSSAIPAESGLPGGIPRRPERRLRLVEAIGRPAEACANGDSRCSVRRVHGRTPSIAAWYERHSRFRPTSPACNIAHYEWHRPVVSQPPVRRLSRELLSRDAYWNPP